MDDAAIKKMVADQLQDSFANQYSPRVVGTMTGVASVVERHMRRGRTKDIDWDAIDKLAASDERRRESCLRQVG
jgi:hypothetical protein